MIKGKIDAYTRGSMGYNGVTLADIQGFEDFSQLTGEVYVIPVDKVKVYKIDSSHDLAVLIERITTKEGTVLVVEE